MMKFKIHKATIYQDAFDKEIGTCITVYNESLLLYDLPNMKKLAGTLHVKGDEMLVKKIAEHFGRHKSFAKHEIQKYCDKREIMYKTHVYY